MKTIINEVEELKSIIIDSYIDNKNPLKSIRVLVKYLYYHGYDKQKTKEQIQKYITSDGISLNLVLWNDRINNAINYIFNKPTRLIYIESVDINKLELEKISELNNENREKMAFAYLVHSKISNKKHGNDRSVVYTPTSDIIKESLCNKPTNKQKKSKSVIKDEIIKDNPLLVISNLVDLGYLEQTRSIGKNTNKTVLFASNNYDKNEEATFQIKDFDNYINYYLRWRYSSVDLCKCGDWYKVTSNRREYCSPCWKEIRSEQSREKSLRYYHKNK